MADAEAANPLITRDSPGDQLRKLNEGITQNEWASMVGAWTWNGTVASQELRFPPSDRAFIYTVTSRVP